MSVQICAIAKNEGKYIREWVIFHQLVGVEHITIYDNGSTDNTISVLQPFVNEGFVDVVDWPYPNPSQLSAYSDYISKHRGPFWCAFIDGDEFLWSPKYNTIQEGLDNCHAPRSAIGVNWMVLNSGGQTEYEDKPVIDRKSVV